MIDDLPTLWGAASYVLRVAAALWALVGVALALAAPAGAYVAEGRWNRTGWALVCGASAVAFGLLGPLSIFGIIGLVAVGVFYADVLPAVKGHRR